MSIEEAKKQDIKLQNSFGINGVDVISECFTDEEIMGCVLPAEDSTPLLHLDAISEEERKSHAGEDVLPDLQASIAGNVTIEEYEEDEFIDFLYKHKQKINIDEREKVASLIAQIIPIYQAHILLNALLEEFNHKNIESSRVLSFCPDIVDANEDWSNILDDTKFYVGACNAMGLSSGEIEELKKHISEKKKGFPVFIDVRREGIFKAFFYCYKFTQINQNPIYCLALKKDPFSLMLINGFRTSKGFVDSHKEQYKQWERIINNIDDYCKQGLYCAALFAHCNENKYLFFKGYILSHFLNYRRVYSEKWEDVNYEFISNLDEPAIKSRAINIIQKSPYIREFCDFYDNYTTKHQLEKSLDLSSINSTPELIVDKDKTHKKWFVKVPEDRINGDHIDHKYKALKRLFNLLLKNKAISADTKEELFIYRFSGLLSPQSPTIKIKRNKGEGSNETFLAVIVKLLFGKSLSEGKPPYKAISDFFNPHISNISGLAKNANGDLESKIKDELEECGFTNF